VFYWSQASEHHFEFFGLDFIMDVHGNAWLLEVNRLPGITSSKQNKVEEDIFFDGVIEGLLNLCVVPILNPSVAKGRGIGEWEFVDSQIPLDHDGDPVIFNNTSTAVWRNVLKFKLYAKKMIAGPLGGAESTD